MAETAGVLTESQYVKLVKEIRALLEVGKARAQAAVAQELVQTYWEIGQRLSAARLTGQANYGASILEDLAEELDVDVRTLQYAIQFFAVYTTNPGGRKLTWSHFRELLRLPDPEARQFYEQEAQRLEWTRDQLAQAIHKEVYEQSTAGGGTARRARTLTRPTAATYVYQAVVERVIDGDTLLLRVDLGFAVWKEQRVRLAEVDTPAMDEPGGQEAFRYARDQLAQARTVVVKTHKIDIYGRYVGHVFYMLQETELHEVFARGRYLNQELVTQGLATTI